MSEAELVAVWDSCRDDDYGRIVRLLILTGQRRGEIGSLAWSEIDLEKRQIDLDGRRCKNHRPHIIPLSEQALAIIEATPRGGRDLLFGRGADGYAGFDLSKQQLDVRIAASKGRPLSPWVLHDLRRSFVTHLGELGIAPPHVVEALVNHVSGSKAGVAGVYNKAVYLAERRKALELWGAHIARLVSRPQPAKPAKPKQSASAGASVAAA